MWVMSRCVIAHVQMLCTQASPELRRPNSWLLRCHIAVNYRRRTDRWRPGPQGQTFKREALITWQVAWKVTERRKRPHPHGSRRPPCPVPHLGHHIKREFQHPLSAWFQAACLSPFLPLHAILDFILPTCDLPGHSFMFQLCSEVRSLYIWHWFLQTMILVPPPPASKLCLGHFSAFTCLQDHHSPCPGGLPPGTLFSCCWVPCTTQTLLASVSSSSPDLSAGYQAPIPAWNSKCSSEPAVQLNPVSPLWVAPAPVPHPVSGTTKDLGLMPEMQPSWACPYFFPPIQSVTK